MLRFGIPLVLAILVLGAAILLTAPGAHERADFTFVNRGSITTLDPAAMSWMQDIRLALVCTELQMHPTLPFEHAASARGAPVRVFTERDAALRWLRE